MDEGLIVIRAVDWRAEFPSRPSVQEALKRAVLPYEDICARYRGIDGEAWPELVAQDALDLDAGLAPAGSLYKVTGYFHNLPADCDARLLMCARQDRTAEGEPPTDDFVFRGFDVGHWFNEYIAGGYTYSAVCNELLFGQYEELRRHFDMLNESLLFPDIAHAADFIAVRRVLLERGADLEESDDEFPMCIISIHEFSLSS